VIPRSFLATLVFALPVLAVMLAVLLAASALAQQMGDAAATRGLAWAAAIAAMALLVDALLLLTVLGIRALDD
jgi:hypothetical protein